VAKVLWMISPFSLFACHRRVAEPLDGASARRSVKDVQKHFVNHVLELDTARNAELFGLVCIDAFRDQFAAGPLMRLKRASSLPSSPSNQS
jgi:hypothetical protein